MGYDGYPYLRPPLAATAMLWRAATMGGEVVTGRSAEWRQLAPELPVGSTRGRGLVWYVLCIENLFSS